MSKQNGDNNGQGPSTGLVTKTRPKTKRPSLYKVLMLNDDYTPMEFVVPTESGNCKTNRAPKLRSPIRLKSAIRPGN